MFVTKIDDNDVKLRGGEIKMKFKNNLILPVSLFSHTAKNLRRHTNYHRHKIPCSRVRRKYAVKELDAETGLYYYGARYLDPRVSRWLSGDPAMYQGDYLPSAPVNDEARKRNGNLPGLGGIFNILNFHVYGYTHNNPIKYTDPDGRNPVLFSANGTFSSGESYDITIFSRMSTKVDVRTSVNDGTATMPLYSQTTTITYDNNGNISQTNPHTINNPYITIDGTEIHMSPLTTITSARNPRIVGDRVVYDRVLNLPR